MRNSVSAKLLMAITGILLLGFVVAHLSGNLLVFAGRDSLNSYALHLRDLGVLLWIARIGLLAVFVVHLTLAIRLTLKNRDARRDRYVVHHYPRSSVASRTMMTSGWLILAFVILHLAHFTFLWLHPEMASWHWTNPYDGRVGHDVYRTVYVAFQSPWYVGLYVVAMIFLAMHLTHAVTSIFQTLGLKTPRTERAILSAGPLVAGLILAGYISIPLAVHFGATESVSAESVSTENVAKEKPAPSVGEGSH